MRYEISTPRKERHGRVAAKAAAQWGCVTTADLRDCGVTSATQDRWLQSGLLHRLHQGVYVFGAVVAAPEQRWAGALLAAGGRAALSHTSAAALHGLIAVRGVTEVTAPTQRRGDASLRVHRGAGEVTRARGLRVTTVRQTLLDLGAIGWPVDRLVHEAAARSLVPLGELKAFALDRRGERGARALLAAVGLPHTRSGWERRFLRWVRTLDGVPAPRMNDAIGALTVDVHWPAHDLVVELDAEQTHGTPWARRRDARRDAYLRRRGKTVRRIGAERFRPEAVEAMLRALLA
jgi:very-short-patch-repair endonuclease